MTFHIGAKNIHFWWNNRIWPTISKYRLKNLKCRNVRPRFDLHWQFLSEYQKFQCTKLHVKNSKPTEFTQNRTEIDKKFQFANVRPELKLQEDDKRIDVFIAFNPSDLKFRFEFKFSSKNQQKYSSFYPKSTATHLARQLKKMHRNSFEILELWKCYRSFLGQKSDMRYLDAEEHKLSKSVYLNIMTQMY